MWPILPPVFIAFYLFSKNVDSQHQKETFTNLNSINSSLEELGEVVLVHQNCMPFPNATNKLSYLALHNVVLSRIQNRNIPSISMFTEVALIWNLKVTLAYLALIQ